MLSNGVLHRESSIGIPTDSDAPLRHACDVNRNLRVALVRLLALSLAGSVFALHRASAQSLSLLADATDPPAPFAAVLRAIPRATVVRIRDGWMGLSPLAPINHRYEFRRVGNDFHAHVVCGAAGQEHALPDLTVPAVGLMPVLTRFATISVSRGPYSPRITHTDDYPNVLIEFETPAGTASFLSHSQGAFAPPWQLTVANGESGVVSASVPGAAAREFLAAVGANPCSDWTRTLRAH